MHLSHFSILISASPVVFSLAAEYRMAQTLQPSSLVLAGFYSLGIAAFLILLCMNSSLLCCFSSQFFQNCFKSHFVLVIVERVFSGLTFGYFLGEKQDLAAPLAIVSLNMLTSFWKLSAKPYKFGYILKKQKSEEQYSYTNDGFMIVKVSYCPSRAFGQLDSEQPFTLNTRLSHQFRFILTNYFQVIGLILFVFGSYFQTYHPKMLLEYMNIASYLSLISSLSFLILMLYNFFFIVLDVKILL